MRIRFGLHLDGQRGWQARNALGGITLGPLGLLELLETHLGLQQQRVAPTERIVQFRQCLRALDGAQRFYHRSLEADELGTAETLLTWRDSWHLHGWSGAMPAGGSRRLRDMAEVEELAQSTVAASLGERLVRIAHALRERNVPIGSMELVDSLESFPLRWREVLIQLRLEPAVLPGVAGKGFLGRLQASLLATAQGTRGQVLSWADDGTVTVVRAETRLMAGHWLATQLGQGDALLVAQTAREELDGMLVAAGHARHGMGEASVLRPSLQVLALALELMWEPLDFHALVQFLTHAICPIPAFARRILAEKLAEKPGIGGAAWDDALQKIETHYDKAKAGTARSVLESIRFWVEEPRHDPQLGASLPAVMARVEALGAYFRNRLGTDDRAVRHACVAGVDQCRALAAALSALHGQGVPTIRPHQLHKLVAQATAGGEDNPLLVAEVGAWRTVTQPAAAIEPCDQVFWWQLEMPVLPRPYPWSSVELAALAAAGVELPDVTVQLERETLSWLRPILAARDRLVLVLPRAGAEVHPLWQLVEAVVGEVPVAELESLLAGHAAGMQVVVSQPLPQKKRFWQLPAGLGVPAPSHASYSSLEMQLCNPYQWLLQYGAHLRSSTILTIADDFLLLGNLAHAVVECHFRQPDALAMTDDDFRSWFALNFERIVREQGAVLLIGGRRSDLEALRSRLQHALGELRRQLAAASVVRVDPEVELNGGFVGGSLMGFADLVVENSAGRRGVVDMKWSGHKKYPAKLSDNRHLQLAVYAELLRQGTGAWPAVAYFLLDNGRLLVREKEFFPAAEAVRKLDDENTAQLWQRFLTTWQWRQAQFKDGLYEVRLEEIAELEHAAAPENGLALEYLNPAYNDYLALAVWED